MIVAGRLASFFIRLLAAVAAFYLCFAIAVRLDPYPVERLSRSTEISRVYTDRLGRELRVAPNESGSRALRCDTSGFGPWIGPATIAIEDRRFARHPGVDALGIMRATARNAASLRIREGASTITQQLARLIRPELRRMPGWRRKILEIWDAVRIERAVSKDEILAQYLNRAPYGNRATGIAAASELYFAKSPDRLTLAEAAILAGLPQAPDRLSPFRHPERARARQRLVLARMRDEGVIGEDEYNRAVAERLVFVTPRIARLAPHLIAALESGGTHEMPAGERIETTLDLDLQREIDGLLKRHLDALAGARVSQAAAVVLDARDGSILAWAGSRDFYSSSQIDGVLALRQPGSALKPFTYALALENGMTPADLIADVPIDDDPDGYRPENFDREHHGPVRLREALAASYNIPAVRVLRDRVGVESLLTFLRATGLRTLKGDAAYYGPALTLGAGEVRLLDLAAAYAMLARGGITVTPHAIPAGRAYTAGERVLAPEIAAQITSILSDDAARSGSFGTGGPLAFPFPAAAKTGTSKDFRDNWAVGYTPRHVVAVWVGNFDGAPMRGVSGVTGAGPLMHSILARVGSGDGPFATPTGLARAVVCPLSGMRPGAACPGSLSELFRAGTEPSAACTFHARREGRVIVEIPAAYRADGYRAM